MSAYDAHHPQAHPRTTPRTSAMPQAAASGRMGFLDKMRVQATPPGSATDPVCHMKVDPAKTPHKLDHEGTTHYFCSAGCKQKFSADPQKFLSGGGGAHHM